MHSPPISLFLSSLAPTMVEVLRDNFYSELPWIKAAIEECDFIAIDAEFSGRSSFHSCGGTGVIQRTCN